MTKVELWLYGVYHWIASHINLVLTIVQVAMLIICAITIWLETPRNCRELRIIIIEIAIAIVVGMINMMILIDKGDIKDERDEM